MVSTDRIDAMRTAVLAGDIRKARILLKAGVPVCGGEPTNFLCLAGMHGLEEMFDFLVANGAALNDPDVLGYSVGGSAKQRRPSTKIVQSILEAAKFDVQTLTECLRFASATENVDVVRMLLDRGADPNGQDQVYKFFPLGNAVEAGHLEVVRALLDAGADPTMEFWDFEENALTGSTSALVDVAIRNGFPEIAKVL